MEILAVGWESQWASVASLLDPLGSPRFWWLTANVLLIAATVMLRRKRFATLLAIAASLASAVSANGLVDDAYIQFRHVSNWLAGYGPVFNPCERLECASGGIWVVLVAVFSKLTSLAPGSAARLLSLFLTPLSTLLAARACAQKGEVFSPAAAILWAAVPTPALYGATGLETSLFAFACWCVLVGCRYERGVLASLGAALLVMCRPEGGLLAVLVLPFWKRLAPTGRQALSWAIRATVLAASVRTIYYGLPVPRSALVKGIIAPAGPSDGFQYIGFALLEWLPVFAGALFAMRRQRPSPELATAVLGWSLVVTLRGGDWMPGGRYLLPLLVGFVFLAATLERHRRVFLTIAITWGAVLLWPAMQPTGPRGLVGHHWRSMAIHRQQSRWWEALGGWLKQQVPPGTRLATGPAGALPYSSQLETFDLYGLCSVVAEPTSGGPGHRLWGMARALEQNTDILYPGNTVPQRASNAEVTELANRMLEGYPKALEHYQLVIIRHQPEQHLDVTTDVIWLRRGQGLEQALARPSHQ